MRSKKIYRIVVDGKTIASRRTARDVAGAIVGSLSAGSPRVLICWVKKRVSEKAAKFEKRLTRMKQKFYAVEFVKAA